MAALLSDLRRIASDRVLLEGPVADETGDVYFSDVREGGVYAARRTGEVELVIAHRKGIGGMAPHASGGLVVSGRNVAHKAPDGTTRILADRDEAAGRFIYNDLTSDPRGRVYAGSFATEKPFDKDGQGRTGALVLIDLDGGVREVDGDFIAPNGIAFSPDGTFLYAVETGRFALWRYVMAPDGGLSDKTRLFDFGEFKPDGMAVAEDGSLWIAMAGKGCVTVLDPEGRLIADVPMPLAVVTSLCFGGPDMRTVFISTGSHGPHREGCMYRARAPVAGVRVTPARVAGTPAP